jgi:hypothetical protein
MTEKSPFHKGETILLRHAEKAVLTKDITEPELPLTAKGVEDAESLGRLLRQQGHSDELRFFVSPRKRCIQTARCIATGAGISDPLILTNSNLGSPGPFVIDYEIGYKVFSNEPLEEIIQKYMMGDQQGCFLPMEIGCQNLYDYLISNSNTDSLSIFVSHDAIVIPFIYWLTSEDLIESWLPPLGGIHMSDKISKILLNPLEVLSSQL